MRVALSLKPSLKASERQYELHYPFSLAAYSLVRTNRAISLMKTLRANYGLSKENKKEERVSFQPKL